MIIRGIGFTIEENTDYYTKGAGNPFQCFKMIDIADQRIFGDDRVSLVALADEYGITRERAKHLSVVIERKIAEGEKFKKYIKNFGGKNEKRTNGR